jgi:hypothetical protein
MEDAEDNIVIGFWELIIPIGDGVYARTFVSASDRAS